MHEGTELYVQVGNQTISGRIALASANLEALVIEIDEPIELGNNVVIGHLPVLKVDGVYQDIICNHTVLIKYAGLMQ